MKGQDDLLERAGVLVPHQIIDQRPVLAHVAGPLTVGNPRRLHDPGVPAEVVDESHEPLVEHPER